MDDKKPGNFSKKVGREATARETAKNAIREEFSRRLQRRMIEAGLTMAELARRATTLAPEGVRIERDTLSTYLRGIALPRPEKLDPIAKALKCEPTDLLPDRGIYPMLREGEPLKIGSKMESMDDGNAWLTINQAVPLQTALAILKLLHDGE